jgi:hypothetical protein
MALLGHLRATSLIAPAFLARLSAALADIQRWRLRLHWARLHDTTSTELHHDEVFLWPTDTAQQQTLRSLPRALYLDAAESQRWQEIETMVAEIIRRSMTGFSTFAAQLPASIALPSSHNTASPSSLLSSFTTMTSEAKEAKREVSEEAEAIVATQPHAAAETKDSTPSSVAQTFNPLAAAVEWTLQQLASKPDSKTSAETAENNKAQTEHITWLAHVMGSCAAELPETTLQAHDLSRVQQDPLFRKHWQVYWAIPNAWRSLYIQQLRQNPTVDTATIIEPLRHAPNGSGQRLRWQEEQAHWQQHSLPQLWKANLLLVAAAPLPRSALCAKPRPATKNNGGQKPIHLSPISINSYF